MSNLAPVAVIVYDRADHLRQSLTALAAAEDAEETTLYVFSDKEKDDSKAAAVAAVRKVISEARGFREVIPVLRESNYGFPGNVLEAWKFLWGKYERVIAMEDDVVVAPGFLRYMNDALEKYESDPRIHAVCGWSWASCPEDDASHYFLRSFSAWGQGRWRNKQFDQSLYPKTADEFRHSWRLLRKANNIMPHALQFIHRIAVERRPIGDISVALECMKRDQFCVFPQHSLVKNIGHDGSGLHCTHADWVESQKLWTEPWPGCDEIPVAELDCHRRASVDFFGRLSVRELARIYAPIAPLVKLWAQRRGLFGQ